MDFLTRQFTFSYNSVLDILNMAGGVVELFKESLDQLGIYMIIGFFAWFIYKI